MPHLDITAGFRRLPKPLRRGAIKFFNPARVRWVRKTRRPRWVTLFVTNRCNARCAHCFYRDALDSKPSELPLRSMKKTLSSLKARLHTLRLSGGEPFLRPDLPALFAFVDQHKIAGKVSIPTNGLGRIVPVVERMRHVQKNARIHISVSLDGMGATHNRFRGVSGGFEKATRNLRRLVALEKMHAGLDVSVAISLGRQLLGPDGHPTPELDALLHYLREDMGVNRVGYDFVRSAETDLFSMAGNLLPREGHSNAKNGASYSRPQLSTAEMKVMLEELIRLEGGKMDRLTRYRLDTQLEIRRTRKRRAWCVAGYADCVIYPDGEVAVCEFSRPFANLGAYHHDLDRLLNSAAGERARRSTARCACTHPCHLTDSLAFDPDFLHWFFDERSNRHGLI